MIIVTHEAEKAFNKEINNQAKIYRILMGCSACGGVSFGLEEETDLNLDDQTEKHQGFTLVYSNEVADYLDNARVDYHTDEYGGHFIVESSYGSSACWL